MKLLLIIAIAFEFLGEASPKTGTNILYYGPHWHTKNCYNLKADLKDIDTLRLTDQMSDTQNEDICGHPLHPFGFNFSYRNHEIGIDSPAEWEKIKYVRTEIFVEPNHIYYYINKTSGTWSYDSTTAIISFNLKNISLKYHYLPIDSDNVNLIRIR